MKIAIDARWIFPEMSGIGVYTREIIRALSEIDRQNEYTLFFNDPVLLTRTLREAKLDKSSSFKGTVLPYGVFSLRNQFDLPSYLSANAIDVYHSTNYMIPLLAPRRTKIIATIHDVIPLIFPGQVRNSRKARMFPLFKLLMHLVARRTDAILTVSRTSAADISKTLGMTGKSAEKIRAIYNGVSDNFKPPPAKNQDPNRTRNILYVGRSDPYKNLVVLVEAFASVRRFAPFPAMLVVAGSPDPRYPEAQARVKELEIESSVSWTGHLTDEELLMAYRQADVLVHPSRYEGFGLQVVEAMACGVPVICSNTGSLAEIAGDAAVTLDPDDISGFADAILSVIKSPSLAGELAQKGLKQARNFTWAQTAREILTVYTERK